DLSSDGGLLLLRQVDQHLGLSRAAADAIPDPRDPERIRHSLRDLLAQRLYGLCCGYEDLNDHQALRDDLLMQTAVGRDEALASAPTFSRLENRATRSQAWALHEALVQQFIDSHPRPPSELVLDIDASDVPLHGDKELSQFHAYYDHHCYLPLYLLFHGHAAQPVVARGGAVSRASTLATCSGLTRPLGPTSPVPVRLRPATSPVLHRHQGYHLRHQPVAAGVPQQRRSQLGQRLRQLHER